jgi:predicted transcriptional regulator
METNSGIEPSRRTRTAGPRHSILDLAPLELECLSVLWPIGEGTVRDIHRGLAETCPRAYTTVMTIMDRLEQKGIVARRKVGRAFHYKAMLGVEEARLKAVEKIVQGFFEGSPDALVAHLSSWASQASRTSQPSQPALVEQGSAARQFTSRIPTSAPASAAPVDATAAPAAQSHNQGLDERLL